MGRKKRNEQTRQVSFVLPETEYRMLQKMATTSGVSQAQVARAMYRLSVTNKAITEQFSKRSAVIVGLLT